MRAPVSTWAWGVGLVGLLRAAAGLAADPVILKIEGLSGALEKNVRASLTLARENAQSAPVRMQLAEERAPEEIRRALEPFGHYRVKISGSVVRQGNNWVARYRVDPGPPILLSEVAVVLSGPAIHEPEMRERVASFPLKEGDVLDHVRYEKGKSALQDLAAELGFFDARLARHEIRVDLAAYQARIFLTLESGRRYTFGDVSFSHTPLDEELLRGFVRFSPGDPFRASILFALQKNLLNSGFFSQADIDPEPERAEDGRTPIQVNLGMAPRNRFDLGGGFGTDTGPRVSLGYRNRYVNAYGHSFQLNARLSFIWNEIDALYTIPLADPVLDQLALSGRTGVEDTLAGVSKIIMGGIRHSTTRWGLREVLALDFLHEDFKISGVSETTLLMIPSINYTWRVADQEVYPLQGFRVDANLAGAWDGLISQVSFGRLRLLGRGLYSFDEESRVLVRGELAELVTNDFDRLPITQRLYAGGDPSVRGYRFNEIAPRNARGDIIGGRHLMVASLEYSRTVYGDWGAAVFSDVGHVYNAWGEPFYVSVGAGVRWASPVGPVRVYIGVPLEQALDPFQVNVILGPDL